MTLYRDYQLQAGDFIFDLAENKKKITEIFFPDGKSSLISSNSTDYDEFWNFSARLQKFKLNITSINYRLEDYLRHQKAENRKHSLSEANWHCIHLIFDMYLDYLQKQKVANFQKLKKSQLNLPIASYRNEIFEKLKDNKIVVIAGDTGCGKSTQVPQYLISGPTNSRGEPILENGFKNICVTQPRRLACISLANRVSSELINYPHLTVGYQVRFEKSSAANTRIVFLTEGLLLRQLQSDPMLSRYDVIVLDEVHERHWQTDCLLGLVKCLTFARPEIRIVLMSATININLFSTFFDGCPIIQVPGRLFPIELYYMPLTPGEQESERISPAPYLRLLQQIDRKYKIEEKGDLLIFLSGMADIQTVLSGLKAYSETTKKWIVLALHSTLSIEEQEKIFTYPPEGVRKCILSTNIAETSVTIDGIRFVADSGKMKEISWDNTSRMRRLKEFQISKASADQRKGRAGRTGPGVCYRLYTEADYNEFQKFNTPEINRVPLDQLVLSMMSMGLPDIRRFPFIEPPREEALEEAIKMLLDHNALRSVKEETKNISRMEITPLGRLLVNFPVDLSIARLLITAGVFRMTEAVLTLAAAMSVQNPFSQRVNGQNSQRLRKMERIEPYLSDHGDIFTIASLFDEWLTIKLNYAQKSTVYSNFSNNYEWKNSIKQGRDTQRTTERDESVIDPQKWCEKLGIEEQRFHEMVRVRAQFADLLRQTGFHTSNMLDEKLNEKKMKSEDLRRKRKIVNFAKRREQFKSKKRRILSMKDQTEDNDEEDSDGQEDADGSITHNDGVLENHLKNWIAESKENEGKKGLEDVSSKDIELVLCYNLKNLVSEVNLNKEKTVTTADMNILKVILAGGLYPHFAIGDPANSYRCAHKGGTAGPGSELVFHTAPQDIFVRYPDVLFSKDDTIDIKVTPEGSNDVKKTKSTTSSAKKLAYSSDHQMLGYLELMETTKPFMVNTVRMPALPCLLIYSNRIDTNFNCTRLVFDKWIQIDIEDAMAAQRILACTIWLRSNLEKVMKKKLKYSIDKISNREMDSGYKEDDPSLTDKDEKHKISKLDMRQQKLLSYSLASFLSSGIASRYTMAKLSAVDVKKLYREQPTFKSSCNLLEIDFERGGFVITEFLTINCLFLETKENLRDKNTPVVTHDVEAEELSLRLMAHRHKEQMAGVKITEKDQGNNEVAPVIDNSIISRCSHCKEDYPGQGILATLKHLKVCQVNVNKF